MRVCSDVTHDESSSVIRRERVKFVRASVMTADCRVSSGCHFIHIEKPEEIQSNPLLGLFVFLPLIFFPLYKEKKVALLIFKSH